MGKLIGQAGSVTIGMTAYNVSNWELTTENDLQDVTDTGSSGWQAMIAGINKADYTFTIFVDSTTIVAQAAAFAPGTSVTATFAIGNSGHSFIVPGLTKSNAIKNPAKNPVELTISASSSGAITLPA